MAIGNVFILSLIIGISVKLLFSMLDGIAKTSGNNRAIIAQIITCFRFEMIF